MFSSKFYVLTFHPSSIPFHILGLVKKLNFLLKNSQDPNSIHYIIFPFPTDLKCLIFAYKNFKYARMYILDYSSESKIFTE